MKKNLLISLCLCAGFLSCSDENQNLNPVNPDDTVVIEDSKPSPAKPSDGFYVANEDWFGHDNGTVNYFKNDGSITYRAYRAANPNESFGVTTCYATIYGGNMYFISKQGNRLVVADAKTLKKKVSIEEIGGDGRSFVGINSQKGYIGTSVGITVFDIKTLSVGKSIEGINGQVGNICLIANRAFAVVQGKGVYVIDTSDDTVEKLIKGSSFNSMTQSKDGNIWIGAEDKLIKVNPYSLETSNIDISKAPIGDSWGAWNPGSLCASTQKNVLYWVANSSMFSSGNTIVQYDINNHILNNTFYTLGKDAEGKKLAFYGAALRVDPLTDKLMVIVKRDGWGSSGSYNWLQILDDTGKMEKSIEVKDDNQSGLALHNDDNGYYWFPEMPFFEDTNEPEILVNQIILKPNDRKAVCLSDKIVDADNMSTAIVKNISYNHSNLANYDLKQDSIIITSFSKTGKTTFTLEANSNGRIVKKEIRVDIRE